MKKSLFWTAITFGVLLLGWLIDPMGAATKTVAYLETSQTFTATKTFGMDLSMTNPSVAPSFSSITTTGTCTNVHRLYVTWSNASGETQVSPASADYDPAGGFPKIIVTRPTIPSNATEWYAWWSTAADSHATIKACGSSGFRLKRLPSDTTSDCFCSTTQTILAPTSNTTHTVNPMVITPLNASFSRPELQRREVCRAGCEYRTIQDAIDSVTDASATKRYSVFVQPGDYPESFTMKSYVSVAGADKYATRLVGNGLTSPANAVTIPTDVTGIGISNMTISGSAGINFPPGTPAGRTTATFMDMIFGITDGSEANGRESIDCFYDQGKLHDITMIGCECFSAFDGVRVGNGTRFFGSGNTYHFDNDDASQPIRVWQFVNNDSLGGQIQEVGFNVTIRTSGSHNSAVWGAYIDGIAGTPIQADRMVLSSGVIRVEPNDSSGTDAGCFWLGTVAANSFGGELTIDNVACTVVSSTATHNLYGLRIDADADHSNWVVNLRNSSISLSGGASRTEIYNNETVGGFVARVSNTVHSGTYGGAGTTTFWDSPITTGVIRTSPLASPPASCLQGDHYFDTSGADCTCTTAGTPGTWTNNNGVGSCA